MKRKKLILTILAFIIALMIIFSTIIYIYLNMDVELQGKSTFLFTTQQLIIEKNNSKLTVDFDSPKEVNSQNKSKESVWINWILEKNGKITSGSKKSYIVYSIKRISPNGVHLNRIEGGQNFSLEDFEFSWSYGSPFYIWVYPLNKSNRKRLNKLNSTD